MATMEVKANVSVLNFRVRDVGEIELTPDVEAMIDDGKLEPTTSPSSRASKADKKG